MFRNRVLTIGFSFLIIALPAAAQQSPVKYPPPCDPSQVTKSDIDRAHSLYLSGKGFLEESNYDKAIGYFLDAYSIDCSMHAILPMAIATAFERKGDKAEAIRSLDEYLKRAPDAPDREVIEHRIKNLQDQLARETPAAPSAAPAASTAPTAPPPPPPPEASAAPPVASRPAAAPSPPPPPANVETEHGAAPWILVGVGGAAVATGIVLYAVGHGNVSSASSQCPNRMCSSAHLVSEGNDGRTLETVGGIVGGVGLAAAAAGLIWHFIEKPTPAHTAGAITPILGPGYVGAGAAGSF